MPLLPITSTDQVYNMLADELASYINSQMFKFHQNASPGEEGHKTLVICDVMIGSSVEVKEDGVEEGAASYWTRHKDQVMLKYVVHLEAKPIATQTRKLVAYHGVSEYVSRLHDGVHFNDMSLRTGAHWRDASDPLNLHLPFPLCRWY